MSSVEKQVPKFSAGTPINGVISIQMNEEFADLLRGFILSVEGEIEAEIWAFQNALKNPGRRTVVRESPLYS